VVSDVDGVRREIAEALRPVIAVPVVGHTPNEIADAVLPVVTAWAEQQECEHHSWAGLMALLDEHWPEDIFPTREDDITRDAGARIVSLVRWVDRLRAALADDGQP